MRVRTLSTLLLVFAVSFVIAVASEVFVDDYVRPRSLFSYLAVSSLVTGIALLAVGIDARGCEERPARN